MVDYINKNIGVLNPDNAGNYPWCRIRAGGGESSFASIRMAGDLLDKYGNEILGNGSSITGYETIIYNPNIVASSAPAYKTWQEAMTALSANSQKSILTNVIIDNRLSPDLTIPTGSWDMNNAVLSAYLGNGVITIPSQCYLGNPQIIDNITLKLYDGGMVYYDTKEDNKIYYMNNVTLMHDPAIVASTGLIGLMDNPKKLVFNNCDIFATSNPNFGLGLISMGGDMHCVFTFEGQCQVKNVFYYGIFSAQGLVTFNFGSDTVLKDALLSYNTIQNNGGTSVINKMGDSQLVRYVDTVLPQLGASDVQSAIDVLKNKQNYTDIFVDNDIPATALPTFKTLAEAGGHAIANPNTYFNVYVKKCEPINGLMGFNRYSRVIGVGDHPIIEFDGNGIVNDVEYWENLTMVFNDATEPANVFNNALPCHRFINCIMIGEVNMAVPVFILLINTTLYFENCTLTAMKGANKQFLSATGGQNINIILNHTTLPDTATFTFTNTGAPTTTMNVSVLGDETTHASLTSNFIGTNIVFSGDSKLDNHVNVLINAPETTHALMYDSGDSKWKNRKIAVADVDGMTVNTAVGYDGSAMTLVGGDLTNVQRSEIASVYTYYSPELTPDPLVVPSGNVMFLTAGNLVTNDTQQVSKIYISFTNSNGVNLFGSGYMKNIDIGGDKISLLVRGLYDEAMSIRGSISFVNVNEIDEQWEITLTNYNPSYSMMFSMNSGISVSLGSPDELSKLLDFDITPPLNVNQVVGWNGLQWTNMTSGGGSDMSAITKEPTGFDNPENVAITYDSNTRTVSLFGANWKAYWRGTEVANFTAGWTSPAHDIFQGNYYLYYDGVDFVWSNTPWTFDKLQIAYVAFQGLWYFGVRECHGLMPWQVHEELHKTSGTYLYAGGDLSNYVLNSTTATNRRVDISTCVLADEDLHTSNYQLLKTDNAGNPYCTFYMNGTTATLVTGQAEIIPVFGAIPQYNLNTGGGVYTTTDFPNNNYGKIFVMAMPVTGDQPSQDKRFVFIMPQQVSGSLNTVRAVAFNSLVLSTFGSALNEYLPIAEIIVRYSGGDWHLISVNKLSGTKQLLISSAVGLTSVSTDGVSITGNGTPSNPLVASGSPTPFASINYHTQYNQVVSQYNVGDPSVINNAGVSFLSNNTSLPINPTWEQHGTYPSALNYIPQKPVTIKVDWHLDIESFPAQTFEIGYGFIDGTMTAVDVLRTGTKVYSGSIIRHYDGVIAPPILFYLALRCTTALNQTVTINKFNYVITCDRAIV